MKLEELDRLIEDTRIKILSGILELNKLLNLKNTLTIKKGNTHD
jgi:hypothetical protein